MSFLRPSVLYRFLLVTYHSLRWMPCQSWVFLRCPSLDSFIRLLIIVLLWSMFSEIRYITSSSMYPTLRVGDRIIVERGLVWACVTWTLLFAPDYPCSPDMASNLLLNFIGLLIIVLLWSMFSEIRYITSSSMYPTLRVGDRIIVERASYYVRRPAIHDIVIFRAPAQQPEFMEEEIFIKRIVARAGDSVEVHHGSLYVNGIAQNEDFIAERPTYPLNLITVPRGHVYVLGDNRNNSNDSHSWGPLPVKNIVGRFVMRCHKPSGTSPHEDKR